MRRSITLLALAVCLLCGQVRAHVGIGIKGGLSAANVSFSQWEGKAPQTKYGMTAGLAVEIPTANRNLSFRCEGLYVQKGTRQKDSYDQWVYNGSVHEELDEKAMIDEIVLAPFFVVRIPQKSVTPFFEIGPEIGFNTRRQLVWKDSYTVTGDYAESGSDSGTEPLTTWDKTNLGMNFGAGMAIPSGRGEFIVNLRYNLGLRDMNTTSNESDYQNEHITAKTHSVNLLLGYNFIAPVY